MPSSFRRDRHNPPPVYRTPSPPRHAIEPVTPIHSAGTATEAPGVGLPWAENTRTHNGRELPYSFQPNEYGSSRSGDYDKGRMDSFARIALCTKTTRHSGRSRIIEEQEAAGYCIEPPPKRAKSEKILSPTWREKGTQVNPRPATSHEQSESRRLEAELLLNFAQEAAKSASFPPVSSKLKMDQLPNSSASLTVKSSTYGSSGSQQHGPGDVESSKAANTNYPSLNASYSPNVCVEKKDSPESSTAIVSTISKNDATVPSVFAPNGTVDRVDTQAILPRHGIDQSRPARNLQTDPEHNMEVKETLEESSSEGDKRLSDFTPHLGATYGATFVGHDKSLMDVGVTLQAKLENSKSMDRAIPLMNDAVSISENGTTVRREKDKSQDLRSEIQSSDEKAPISHEDKELSNEVSHIQREVWEDESPTIDGPEFDRQVNSLEPILAKTSDSGSRSLDHTPALNAIDDVTMDDVPSDHTMTTAVCVACNFARNSIGIESDSNSTSWISCDACKSWFHFACAGFKNEREVRSVDKFRCRKCKPIHGSTTYVRKSSRAHSAIDYAGLHQGVIKTSDERPEHHYIKPIKDGTITFLPENFARMHPDLVTVDYFEKGTGMKEPVVIPACLNPRPSIGPSSSNPKNDGVDGVQWSGPSNDTEVTEDLFSRNTDSEYVPDHGQDALDMVIPQGLTVRQVAELYGLDEKVEVIDVKSQNGENKKWNMRKWAEYYENPNNKVVRNVISLEVSQSRLGRLIRRPKIVRDLDLQDSVWPEDLLAKGEYPRVQFYCLMSVSDCFTDFHIDFGGSSVFYHILKGKKTFLFIPPKEKHLKKYEEWCMSPAQNWTFLGDQTKECYRVDLSEGDTMLIPAGWIHAVWTPEDSLVIGGNFLTRMNYGMQLRVAQVEKATGVARKFRYPHFQKLHWYTALRYLERDPLPDSVKDILHAGSTFKRAQPAYHEFNSWGENSQSGRENYHARYYSQAELDGLPDLTRYLLRTALIDLGSITDGITAETRKAVKKSIPRGHGEPLDILKTFAAWCAWKRGNESIPHWAYPDAVPENLAPDKLSAAAMKKLDQEAALQAPRRQSARMHAQQELSQASLENAVTGSIQQGSDPAMQSTANATPLDPNSTEKVDQAVHRTLKRPRNVSNSGTGSHRKTACESCRKRRRACKHKDDVAASTAPTTIQQADVILPLSQVMTNENALAFNSSATDLFGAPTASIADAKPYLNANVITAQFSDPSLKARENNHQFALTSDEIGSGLDASFMKAPPLATKTGQPSRMDVITGLDPSSGNVISPRPRHKACDDCRKSKRRCVHDAHGNEDPIKVREAAIPRPHARKNNIHGKSDLTAKKSPSSTPNDANQDWTHQSDLVYNTPVLEEHIRRPAPVANMIAKPSASSIEAAKTPNMQEPFPKTASDESKFDLPDPLLLQNNTDLTHAELESREDPPSLRTRESHDQPTSSLVSPPASSHDDVGSSPIENKMQWTPSASPSHQSSNQPKQTQQRFTPESGPMRRDSSSSYGEAAVGKAPSPNSILTEAPSSSTPNPKRVSGTDVDEESLRLIKELQAQEEYGLRRRAKG